MGADVKRNKRYPQQYITLTCLPMVMLGQRRCCRRGGCSLHTERGCVQSSHASTNKCISPSNTLYHHFVIDSDQFAPRLSDLHIGMLILSLQLAHIGKFNLARSIVQTASNIVLVQPRGRSGHGHGTPNCAQVR